MRASSTAQPRPNVLIILTDDQRLDGTMDVMPKTRAWFHTGGVPGYTSVAVADDTGQRTGVLLIPSDVESEARHAAVQRLLDAILCAMDGKPAPPNESSSGPS